MNQTDKFYCLKCKQKSSDTSVSTKKPKSTYKANKETKNCQINVDPVKTKSMSKSCDKSNSANDQKAKPGPNDKVKLNSNNTVIPSTNDKSDQIPCNKINPSSCKENNQNEIDKITTNACHKTITSPVDMIKNISDEISQKSTIQSLNDDTNMNSNQCLNDDKNPNAIDKITPSSNENNESNDDDEIIPNSQIDPLYELPKKPTTTAKINTINSYDITKNTKDAEISEKSKALE